MPLEASYGFCLNKGIFHTRQCVALSDPTLADDGHPRYNPQWCKRLHFNFHHRHSLRSIYLRHFAFTSSRTRGSCACYALNTDIASIVVQHSQLLQLVACTQRLTRHYQVYGLVSTGSKTEARPAVRSIKHKGEQSLHRATPNRK